MTLAILAFVLGVARAQALAGPDQYLGSVVAVSGSAQIERGSATLAAVQGTIVQSHDRVATAPGASLTLEFSDGSSIALGESTTVEVESTVDSGKTADNRVMLLNGRLHTVVPDKATGVARTIEVDTPLTKAVAPAAAN